MTEKFDEFKDGQRNLEKLMGPFLDALKKQDSRVCEAIVLRDAYFQGFKSYAIKWAENELVHAHIYKGTRFWLVGDWEGCYIADFDDPIYFDSNFAFGFNLKKLTFSKSGRVCKYPEYVRLSRSLVLGKALFFDPAKESKK